MHQCYHTQAYNFLVDVWLHVSNSAGIGEQIWPGLYLHHSMISDVQTAVS
jgi:hypothetical protein